VCLALPCLALPSLVPLRPSSKALQKNQNKNNKKVDVIGLKKILKMERRN
jgi:hypothetical protein